MTTVEALGAELLQTQDDARDALAAMTRDEGVRAASERVAALREALAEADASLSRAEAPYRLRLLAAEEAEARLREEIVAGWSIEADAPKSLKVLGARLSVRTTTRVTVEAGRDLLLLRRLEGWGVAEKAVREVRWDAGFLRSLLDVHEVPEVVVTTSRSLQVTRASPEVGA